MTSDGGNVGGADLELSTPVTPTAQGLNPNANVFESKLPSSPAELNTSATWDDGNDAAASPTLPLTPLNDGYPYMNGDVSKLQPTAVVFSTAASPAAAGVPTPGTMPTEFPSMADEAIVGAADGMATYTTPQTPDSGTNEESITDEVVHENGLPHDQLKARLQYQLEYYFSRENLSVDMYLVSQMDSDQYVPIWTVANFNKIRELTKDINLIVQVLRESPNVQVDEAGEKVRPNHKRCIVILREVPQSTPVEEVESLFQGENCPRFVSCEFAHNNSWYVTFESDDDAQRAYRYLREEVKNFQGKPIMARIKAKPLPRAPLMLKNGMRPAHLDPNLYPQSQQQPPTTPRYTTAYQTNAAAATTMPNMGGYNGQQLHVYFPPFYPPNMLQTWATSPTYLDIGSVFSMNGLAPQSAYKPPSSGGRHSFQSIRNRNQKSHGRGGGQDNMDRLDTRPSQFDQQSRSSDGSMQARAGSPAPAMAINGNGTSNDVQVSCAGHGAMATHDVSHSRRESGQTTPISAVIASPVMPASVEEMMTTTTTTQPMVSAGYRQEPQTLQTSQPQRRNRRRKREEEIASTKNNRPETGVGKTQPASLKEMKQVSPKFDFEAASFPPLPGMGSSTDGSCGDGDALENRMSDVVKGTAKPSTVELKAQTFAPLSPGIREHSTLTNGGEENFLAATAAVPTPPPSPVPVVTRVSKGVITADKATRTDESLMKGAEMNASSHQKQQMSSTTINAFSTNQSIPSPKTTTTTNSGPPKTPSTPNCKAAPTVTTSNAATMTSTASSPTPAISPGSNGKDASAKPSYAQMAQRARERFEKMALEQKETEKDQRRKNEQPQPSNSSNNFNSGANKHNNTAARQPQQHQQPQQQQQQQQQVPSKDGRHPRDYQRNNNGSREKYNNYPMTDQPRDNRFRRTRSQKENEFREDNRRRDGGWPKFSK